jgi:TP901 family phage tail tape measure protein
MAGNDIILNVGANLSPAQRQLQGFVTQAQRQLGSQSFEFKLNEKGFRQPLGRITGDLNQFQGAMDASIARTLAFGASVGAIGGVTKAFKDMVVVTSKVEHSLAEINVLLRLSTKDLQGFSKELFAVAKNTASSFDTVTTAATEFSRQGLSAAETAKRVNNALILTRLSGLDAEASVSALTAAVNGFKSEAITTTEVVNRLANVDAKFAVSSGDLAKALSRAGAVSTDAKVKFNELVAATTAVQQATARGGNVIGNGFKTIFTRIQRSKVREELEKIGVATTTATGSIRGAMDVLTDYANVYKNLSDQQKAFTSEQVAGVFQINTLKALLGDLSNEFGVYNQALATANNTTNEAVQRNAQLNDTLQSLASQTGTEIAELAAKIGTISFEGNFKGLLGLFKGILGSLNQGLDSEGAGSDIAKGIMSGMGNFLSGPGLSVALVGITRLLGFIGKQTTQAIGQVLAIGSRAEKRQVVQQKINALLQEDNNLLKQIFASSGHIDDINKLVTKSINDQNRALANQKLLVSEIARSFQVTKAGSIGPVGGGKRGAEGFIPNLVRGERSSISQGVGGARSGDRPVVIPNFNFGRGAKGTMVAHTGEHIVPNFAGGGSAIFNRNMASSMGLPRGAKRVGAAQGFIPNFAPEYTVTLDDDYTSRSRSHKKGDVVKVGGQLLNKLREKNAIGPETEAKAREQAVAGAIDPQRAAAIYDSDSIVALVSEPYPSEKKYQWATQKKAAKKKDQVGREAAFFHAAGTKELTANAPKDIADMIEPLMLGAANKLYTTMVGREPAGGVRTIPDGVQKMAGSIFEAVVQKLVGASDLKPGAGLDIARMSDQQKKLISGAFRTGGIKSMSGAEVKISKSKSLMKDVADKLRTASAKDRRVVKKEGRIIEGGQLHNAAGGYIPSFANLAAVSNTPAGKRALKTERALAGSSRMGFDSRVGYGVFNNSQGSLGNAVSQHLNAGDSMSSLASAGESAQAAVAAAAMGFLPNFAKRMVPKIHRRRDASGQFAPRVNDASGGRSSVLGGQQPHQQEIKIDTKDAGEDISDGINKGLKGPKGKKTFSSLGQVMAATFTAEMVAAQVSGAIKGEDFESGLLRERISGTVSAATTFGALGAQIHPVVGIIAGLGAATVKLVGTFDEAANAVDKLRMASATMAQQQDQGNAALANYINLVSQFQDERDPQRAGVLLAQVKKALSEVQGPLQGKISERGMNLDLLRQMDAERIKSQGGERQALSLETARALEKQLAKGNFWTQKIAKGIHVYTTMGVGSKSYETDLEEFLRFAVDEISGAFGGKGISGKEADKRDAVTDARKTVGVMLASQSTFEGSLEEIKKIGREVFMGYDLGLRGVMTVGTALDALKISEKDRPEVLTASLNDDVADASKEVQDIIRMLSNALEDRITFERGEGVRIARANADTAAKTLAARLEAMRLDPSRMFGRAVQRVGRQVSRDEATEKFIVKIDTLQKKYIQSLPGDVATGPAKQRASFEIERRAIERGKDVSLATSQVKFLKKINTEVKKTGQEADIKGAFEDVRDALMRGDGLEDIAQGLGNVPEVEGLLKEQIAEQKAIRKAAERQETLLKLGIYLQKAQKEEKIRAATRGELGEGKLDLVNAAKEIRKNLALISKGAGTRRPTQSRALQEEAGAMEGILSKFGNIISEGLKTSLEEGGKKKRTFANLQQATGLLVPGFQNRDAQFGGTQDYLKRLIPALERRLDTDPSKATKRLSPQERLNSKLLLDIAKTSQKAFQKSPQSARFEKWSQQFRLSEALAAKPDISREAGIVQLEQDRVSLLRKAERADKAVEAAQDSKGGTLKDKEDSRFAMESLVKQFILKDEKDSATMVKSMTGGELITALEEYSKGNKGVAQDIKDNIKKIEEEEKAKGAMKTSIDGLTGEITELTRVTKAQLQGKLTKEFEGTQAYRDLQERRGSASVPYDRGGGVQPSREQAKQTAILKKHLEVAEATIKLYRGGGRVSEADNMSAHRRAYALQQRLSKIPGSGYAAGSLGGAFMNERRDIAKGVGGAIPGLDKPSLIPNFNGQPVVAHTGEVLVDNYNGGKSAIFNRNMISSMGMPGGARVINAADGMTFKGGPKDPKKQSKIRALKGRADEYDDSPMERSYVAREWKKALKTRLKLGTISQAQYNDLVSSPPSAADVKIVTDADFATSMGGETGAVYNKHAGTLFMRAQSFRSADPSSYGAGGSRQLTEQQEKLKETMSNEFSHLISDRLGRSDSLDTGVLKTRLNAVTKAFNKLPSGQRERFLRWHGDPNKGLVHEDSAYYKMLQKDGTPIGTHPNYRGRAAEEMLSTITSMLGRDAPEAAEERPSFAGVSGVGDPALGRRPASLGPTGSGQRPRRGSGRYANWPSIEEGVLIKDDKGNVTGSRKMTEEEEAYMLGDRGPSPWWDQRKTRPQLGKTTDNYAELQQQWKRYRQSQHTDRRMQWKRNIGAPGFEPMPGSKRTWKDLPHADVKDWWDKIATRPQLGKTTNSHAEYQQQWKRYRQKQLTDRRLQWKRNIGAPGFEPMDSKGDYAREMAGVPIKGKAEVAEDRWRDLPHDEVKGWWDKVPTRPRLGQTTQSVDEYNEQMKRWSAHKAAMTRIGEAGRARRATRDAQNDYGTRQSAKRLAEDRAMKRSGTKGFGYEHLPGPKEYLDPEERRRRGGIQGGWRTDVYGDEKEYYRRLNLREQWGKADRDKMLGREEVLSDKGDLIGYKRDPFGLREFTDIAERKEAIYKEVPFMEGYPELGTKKIQTGVRRARTAEGAAAVERREAGRKTVYDADNIYDPTRRMSLSDRARMALESKRQSMRASEAAMGKGIKRRGASSRRKFDRAGASSRRKFDRVGSRSRSRFGGAAEGFIPNLSIGEGLGAYGSVAGQFLNFAEGGGAGAGGVAGAGGGGEMAASMGAEGGALMVAGQRGITQTKASQQKHNVNVNIEVYGNVSEGAIDGIQSNSSDVATVLEGLVNGGI